MNSSDDRTLRQRDRVRKKIQQRQPAEGSYHAAGRSVGQGQSNKGNGEIHHDNRNHGSGDMEADNEPSPLMKCLSAIPPPKVFKTDTRSAIIHLTLPEHETMEVDLQNCGFELLLSDKGKDAKYKTVYCGDAREITLNDLKPASEYYLRVRGVVGEETRGALTEPVSFNTLSCEPDRPQPPKLTNSSKNSLLLKWNAACDNGSKISTYCLEWDQGQGDDSFTQVYSGINRQHRVTQLKPSTQYVFRLAAVNAVGQSPWSEVVSFFTSGSVPSAPEAPALSEQSVTSITVSWARRQEDEEFLLQMEDETTGHGFIPVYNGQGLSHCQKQLRRSSQYRFRLAAKNEEGASKWSEAVTFSTLPDQPAAPLKPHLVGKVLSRSFTVAWESPGDDGGAEVTKYVVELDSGQGYELVYEGFERQHYLQQLTPGCQYSVRVACTNVAGQSQFSGVCVATTQPVVPGQCAAPRVQGKPRATALSLRWSSPSHDGGARITQYAAQMVSPDGSEREVYRGFEQSCMVAGLSPGRVYHFQVCAVNRVGTGPWSEMLEVTTGAGAPDAPSSPQTSCPSPHSAMVTWDPPPSNGAAITEYRLECSVAGEDEEFSQVYVGPHLSYEAKGLTPATSYVFRLQAVNSAGSSPYSPVSTCQTPPSSPGAVTDVRCQAAPTCIQLQWRPPPCNGSDLLSYNIAVSDKQVIAVEPVPQYTLDNLLPRTVYRIRIQAVNGVGVGPYSSVSKVTTQPLVPDPPCLECVSVTSSSIKLKWGDGRNTDFVRYTLEMDRGSGSFQPVYSGTAHSHKVSRLSELTSYHFRIFATNDTGNGPYSTISTFTTTTAPPPAVKGVRVQDIEQDRCTVEWEACRCQGSDPITYILQLQQLHGTDLEYKQVYRGPQSHHTLHSLQPASQYQLRVCAVRQTTHASSSASSRTAADIPGPFSAPTFFSTSTPETKQEVQEKAASQSAVAAEPRQWTDQQWAMVIMLGLVVVAVVVAVVVQHVLASV